jgi:copper(I)-binding protein
MRFRLAIALFAAWTLAGMSSQALAHGASKGELVIDHPYATPSLAGSPHGVAYLRGVRNKGQQADRLIRASSPVAERVELPAKTELRMRHGTPNGHHLMLLGLKAQLKDGDRLPVTLTFQRAGEREVMVWVQTPRDGAAPVHNH